MQILRSPKDDPAWNLAAEEYLFQQDCGAYLFLYVNRPTVVIGCNQILSEECDEKYCCLQGIDIVRRISGGGAVFHDYGNLNYCFIQENEAVSKCLETAFLQPVVSVLQSFGLRPRVGKRKDLWIGNGKISGTASHFTRHKSLHHGTLLYDADLKCLYKALGLVCKKDMSVGRSVEILHGGSKTMQKPVRGIFSVPAAVTNIRPFMEDHPLPEVFYCKFIETFCGYYRQNLRIFTASETAAIDVLCREKYRSEAWIHKK